VKTEILIVSFKRDFAYAQWLFRSIAKFCKGFSAVRLLVPTQDYAQAEGMVHRLLRDKGMTDAQVQSYDEWPTAGFLHHMAQIMRADEWCPAADFILHVDADCVFNQPVTPETYIKNGKPIMRFEYFSKIGVRRPDVGAWQAVTQAALPFLVTKETMRCHPGVFHGGLYPEARRQIEIKTKDNWLEYIKRQRGGHPAGFCEFNVLGNVALHCFPEKYEAVEQIGDRVQPDNCLQQFWSHGAIDQPQQAWIKGEQKDIVPLQFIREILK
jgi:hypothetical protein